MKHKLTNQQIKNINEGTQFEVFKLKSHNLYELRYKNPKYGKTMTVYIQTDSFYCDLPCYKQVEKYANEFNPDEFAASRYLEGNLPPKTTLINLMDYAHQYQADLKELANLVNY